MGDHFGLLMDRLLTEATLEATIEGQRQLKQALPSAMNDAFEGNSSHKTNSGSGRVVECRICQDEDEYSNMEVPCSCCGSLKYAHRRCVQRWCNEKGDTFCEICHQQFKPGYTSPPGIFQFSDIPMTLRENWEISQRNPNNPHLITMVSSGRNFRDHGYDDFADSTARSLVCCRLVAIIFMLLVFLRHALPLIIDVSEGYYSFPTPTVILLRATCIVFPLYIICTAVIVMQRKQQRRQVIQALPPSSSELDMEGTLQHQEQEQEWPPYVVHVH